MEIRKQIRGRAGFRGSGEEGREMSESFCVYRFLLLSDMLDMYTRSIYQNFTTFVISLALVIVSCRSASSCEG